MIKGSLVKDVFSKEGILAMLLDAMPHNELVPGPHGYMHAFRTMLIAGKINQEMAYRGDPTVVLCAATFHDIGRLDDSGDALHGYRGVPKALAIMDQILEPRERSWDFQAAWDCIKGKVACIVGHHCLPMKGLFFEQKVVMDADKLERYRLGEQNWPDPHRLGLDVSRNLMDWAKQLIMEQGG